MAIYFNRTATTLLCQTTGGSDPVDLDVWSGQYSMTSLGEFIRTRETLAPDRFSRCLIDNQPWMKIGSRPVQQSWWFCTAEVKKLKAIIIMHKPIRLLFAITHFMMLWHVILIDVSCDLYWCIMWSLLMYHVILALAEYNFFVDTMLLMDHVRLIIIFIVFVGGVWSARYHYSPWWWTRFVDCVATIMLNIVILESNTDIIVTTDNIIVIIITGNVIGFSVETAVKDCSSSNYKKVHMCVLH